MFSCNKFNYSPKTVDSMLFDITEVEIFKGYEKEFSGLLNRVANKEITQELGEGLKPYVQEFAALINPNDFQKFYDDAYGRNYIGQDEASGWEAIVMTWKKGNRSAIHGHPQYASYTVVAGNVLLEVFEETEGGLKKVLEHTAQPGESFFAVSKANNFKNHIHRLSCLTDTAHTLHLYSDDARRGFNYNSYKILT
jgi:quercetin dioxygenase-like cupin family protein